MVFHDIGGLSQIIYFVLFFAFIFLYPKLMISQMVNRIQREVIELQKLTEDSLKVTSKAMKRPSKEVKPKIRRFLEFFQVTPIDMDPSGIVNKLGKVLEDSKDSIHYFVSETSGVKDETELRNLEGAVMHSVANHEIAKIVNHFLELVKKYKNLQIAMIVNMQLPIIRDIAKSLNKSVKAFVNQDPIGDSVGPLVAAELIGKNKSKKLGKSEMVYATTKINGRKCVIVKAEGPGCTVGSGSSLGSDAGNAVASLIKKAKPVRIITVDAKSKLEGEKSGSLAEGVGVAMGGVGVERYRIEDATLNIPVDAIGIKMSQEEAITWMTEDIYKAVPGATDYVKEKLKRVPKSKTAMIIGVGNTIGIPNGGNLNETYAKIKKNARRVKKEKEEEKNKKWYQKK